MRLAESREVFSNGIVQTLVLFPHDESLARRQVVDMHGEFHHGTIQRQQRVHHRVAVPAVEGLIAQSAPFSFVLPCHGSP